jgi:hypothetical protein
MLYEAIQIEKGGRFQLTDILGPVERLGRAIVKVTATSVNRGEIHRARAAKSGSARLRFCRRGSQRRGSGGPAVGARVTVASLQCHERLAGPRATVCMGIFCRSDGSCTHCWRSHRAAQAQRRRGKQDARATVCSQPVE